MWRNEPKKGPRWDEGKEGRRSLLKNLFRVRGFGDRNEDSWSVGETRDLRVP